MLQAEAGMPLLTGCRAGRPTSLWENLAARGRWPSHANKAPITDEAPQAAAVSWVHNMRGADLTSHVLPPREATVVSCKLFEALSKKAEEPKRGWGLITGKLYRKKAGKCHKQESSQTTVNHYRLLSIIQAG